MNLKKLKDQSKSLDETINLIPMINLIFLLLIFFLLTGVISKKDSELIERPVSSYGVEQNVEKKSVIFLINKENQIYFNDEKINIDRFEKILDSGSEKYIIDIDKNAKIFLLNDIISSMKAKKIDKVFLKVSNQELNE
ncbi:MAG: biopolymer transporter ExbD [Alphaproteobacteria bacterium]